MSKFKVGDVVWVGTTLYNPFGDFDEYYRNIGLIIEVGGTNQYTLETEGDMIVRSEDDMYSLFNSENLDELRLDYKLILEKNQELLESIKDTREWLERMVKLHNAMVRTIVEGERKILDTIKQEEQ